jgi:hypothetical protein
MGPTSLLTKEEHVTIVALFLVMRECGLSIPLQQLKMKVAKVTQTRPHINDVNVQYDDSLALIHMV